MSDNRIDRLIRSYERHIRIPWNPDLAPPQRVLFAVYDSSDELRLRMKIREFELATRQAGHGWCGIDITDAFPFWFASQKYAEEYFQEPALAAELFPELAGHLETLVRERLEACGADAGMVVALFGVGSLFGVLRVQEAVERIAPLVPGRLLVLFPGTAANNNFRLLDGYDGWNYHAVLITADSDSGERP